jgi:hypothetical protein
MYCVYQTNKPANSDHFPELKKYGWNNCVFEELKDAIKYAQNWCGDSYPVVPDNAVAGEKYLLSFETKDGETEYMLIREYDKCVHTEHCCDIHKHCKYWYDCCPCCRETHPIPATYGCNCDW